MKKKFKEIIDKYGTMHILGSYGGCSCGEAELFGVKIHSHCHKSNGEWMNETKCDHEYACVHVFGKSENGLIMKDVMDVADLFAKDIAKNYACQVDTEAVLD